MALRAELEDLRRRNRLLPEQLDGHVPALRKIFHVCRVLPVAIGGVRAVGTGLARRHRARLTRKLKRSRARPADLSHQQMHAVDRYRSKRRLIALVDALQTCRDGAS